MKRKLILIFSLLASCSADVAKKDKSTGSEDPVTTVEEDQTETADAGSDEPADVNALYLSLACESRGSHQDKGRYLAQCRLLDKDGVSVAPDKFSDSYVWSVSGGVPADNLVITEVNDADGYAVTIAVGDAVFVPLEMLSALEIKFDYVDAATKAAATLKSRMIEMYAGLANQKYFRFVIFSIRDHDPALPIQYLSSIEFKVDGDWKGLTMDPLTGLMSLGDKPVPSNGDISDAAIFLNIFGQNSPTLPAAAMTRFSNNPPKYEAISPLSLNFGNGVPKSVTGFRYNGGAPLVNKNVAAGFPDSFQFETSADKTEWTVVKGSKIDIESINDQDVFEYVWSGFEL